MGLGSRRRPQTGAERRHLAVFRWDLASALFLGVRHLCPPSLCPPHHSQAPSLGGSDVRWLFSCSPGGRKSGVRVPAGLAFAGLSRGLQTAITHPPCPHKASPLCPKPLVSPCVSTSPLITSHVGLGPAHRASVSPNHPFPRPASFCSLVLRGGDSARTRELGGTPLSSCHPPCDRP